jgi:hypothetical protein
MTVRTTQNTLKGALVGLWESLASTLKAEFGITMLMGFEIEIVFMRPVLDEAKSTYTEFLPLHIVHSWSNMTYQQIEMLPMIEEIVDALAEIDIHLHRGSGSSLYPASSPSRQPMFSTRREVLFKHREDPWPESYA